MEVELKHTWRVNRRAWYIRFYCWLWAASREDITFCKLWWGYLLIPLGLILHFLVFLWMGTATAVNAYREEHPKEPYISMSANLVVGRPIKFWINNAGVGKYEPVRWEEGGRIRNAFTDHPAAFSFAKPGTYKIKAYVNGKEIIREITIRPQPVMPMRVLEAIAQMPLKATFLLDSKPIQLLGKALAILGLTFIGVLLLAGASGIGYIFYEAATHLDTWTGWTGHALAVAFNVVGLYVGIALVVAVILLLTWNHFFPPTVYVAKKGAIGFREVMKIGYVSVKSNTCPRVEIED